MLKRYYFIITIFLVFVIFLFNINLDNVSSYGWLDYSSKQVETEKQFTKDFIVGVKNSLKTLPTFESVKQSFNEKSIFDGIYEFFKFIFKYFTSILNCVLKIIFYGLYCLLRWLSLIFRCTIGYLLDTSSEVAKCSFSL